MTGIYDELFSERAKEMKTSEIRELLKLTQQPGMISFAGGLPSPDAFPIEEIKEICNDILKNQGADALQYGTTEGYAKLREEVSKWLKEDSLNISPDNILITPGSQQGLDLTAKIFINHKDVVVVGAPTYLGGLGAFIAFRGKLESVLLDDENMRTDILGDTLHKLHRHGENVKFIYVIPTFDNPSGTTMPEKRRRQLVDMAHEYDVLIVEDDPYSRLRYSGEPVKPVKAFDDEGRVIYMFTFSKLLAPGFRLGVVAGEDSIIRKIVIAKQSADLCSNTFTQYITAEFMARNMLAPHVEKIKKIYRERRNAMLHALDEHFSGIGEWTKPEGGLFVWARLPEFIDTREMFPEAVKEKVAYVTGRSFYAYNKGGRNCMRLNFSYSATPIINEGIERLAKVAQKEIKRKESLKVPLPFEGPILTSP